MSLRQHGPIRSWPFLLLLLTALVSAPSAESDTPGALSLADGEDGALGEYASYLRESDRVLELNAVVQRRQRGGFQPVGRAVPSYGIGGHPVWYHVEVENPTDSLQLRYLVLGKTWLDEFDIYHLRGGALVARWRAGDAVAEGPAVKPGVGFAIPIEFSPGANELYIRGATLEPLVLSASLLDRAQLQKKEGAAHYRHGLLYGFLLAFIFYNTMLYIGLKDRSNLYYALYLLSYIGLSLTYNGHAQAWLWPGLPEVQRYSIMMMMVVFGCAGFLFAGRFLQLDLHAPQTRRWVVRGSLGTLGLMILCILLGSHYGTVVIAFNFLAIFTASMVMLGCLTISHGERAGYYFLCAAVCSMVGVAVTLFAVWGFIPVNSWTFHGVEFGLVLEATLFSLALASRVRMQEQARRTAEKLSRIDTLTGLPNRRAFCADAVGLWSTAQRHNRPLSVIMLDIDHFKKINDDFGHPIGDTILVNVARLLLDCCREGDLVTRWGGEEFVLLLPETALEQACAFSERIRRIVDRCELAVDGHRASVSVSLGVAQRGQHMSLEELISEADQWMYNAKNTGRNRVAFAEAGSAT